MCALLWLNLNHQYITHWKKKQWNVFQKQKCAFGVDERKHVRHEIGGYVRANYQKDIMENVKLTTTLGLFSNYLNNPQNIDINWDLMILMKVNKLITVSINTNLIYDDDAKITRDDDGDGINEVNGPRTQFKEIITLGLSYKL